MFHVVAGVGEAKTSVDTQLLRLTVRHQQTHFALQRHDACCQLVVLTLLHAGVVHLQDTISFQQSAAVGRRSDSHLTSVATEFISLHYDGERTIGEAVCADSRVI